MEIRKLPIGQGLAWFRQAIDLGARNPRAVFGAALLFLLALYAVALVFAIVGAMVVGQGATPAAGQGPDLRDALIVAAPLFLVVMVLAPILLGGLMHVIRETESGRPVRARDVFLPLRSPAGRRLAGIGLVQVALTAVGGLLVAALAGEDYWRNYAAAMQSAMQGQVEQVPQPDHAGLLLLLQFLLNYVSYVLVMFAIPLMLFSGARLGEAVKATLQAGLRNLGANLLAGVLFIGALLAATLAFALVALVLGLVGGAVHPVLGNLLVAMAGLGFVAGVLVLLVGGGYLAWRDTFGEGPAAMPGDVHGIEV